MSLEHLDADLTPQQAKERLSNIGVGEQAIPFLLQQNEFGSHELKALALIAMANEPQNLKDKYLEVRRE